jgi:uncharacterized protein (TIGR00297 family)
VNSRARPEQILLTSIPELLIGISAVSLLAFLAVRLGTIDWSGAISGAIISIIAFIAGSIAWLVTIIIFFVVSSVFTRYRYDYKRKLGSAQEKGGRRSWPNTLANGGIAAAASVAEILTHSNIFAVAFLTSVAAALSDTLATEIGLLSNSRPRLITDIRKFVAPGTSGGITPLGEVVALVSSSSLALLGIGTMVLQESKLQFAWVAFAAVVGGAMIGTTLDSLLGSSIQAIYKCTVCGTLTENSMHHGKQTVLVKGNRLLNNNSVNLIGILAGSLSSILIFAVLVPGTL